MLIVFGGLPGTGKTTLARAVAARHGATYLRIDAIEQAIRDARVLSGGVGPAGYAVAAALAQANLGGARWVVVDGVNPVAESRALWPAVAARTGSPLIEVEIVCSDRQEHQRRVETRSADIAGLVPPTWTEVLGHDYQTWDAPRLVVDTALLSVDAAVSAIEARIDATIS